MCFRHVTEYSCGHSKLVEQPCAAVQAHPYAATAFCENYIPETPDTASTPCGRGSFYCKETPDGRFLERVHVTLDRVHHELRALVDGLNELAAFSNSGGTMIVGGTARSLHDRFASKDDFGAYRYRLAVIRKESLLMAQKAFEFHKRRTHILLITGQPVTLEKDEFLQWLHQTGPLAPVTAQPINVSTSNAPVANQPYTPRNDERENIQAIHLQQNIVPSQQHATQILDRSRFQPPIPDKKKMRTSSKKQRTTRQTAPAPAPEPEPEVRRSARTRNKTVKYAESETSSIRSRDPSPVKSEVSEFSFTESQSQSLSPEKITRQAPHLMHQNLLSVIKNGSGALVGSLGTRINEWKRSGGADSAVAKSEMEYEQLHPGDIISAASQSPEESGLERQAMPRDVLATHVQHNDGITSNFAADYIKRMIAMEKANDQLRINTDAQSLERPPTRYGPPTKAAQGQDMTYAQPPALPNFLSNPPDQIARRPMQTAGSDQHPLGDATATPQASSAGARLEYPAPNAGSRQWVINSPAFNIISALSSGRPRVNWTGSPPVSDHHMQEDATGAFDAPFDIGNEAEIMARADSALGTIHQDQTSAAAKYARLRRSFGSTTTLTPSAVAAYALSSTDPKKRKLPDPSPGPRKKRVRLSLPGDDPSAPNLSSSGLTYSSLVPSSPPARATLVEADTPPDQSLSEEPGSEAWVPLRERRGKRKGRSKT